jgi:hypothetical protein
MLRVTPKTLEQPVGAAPGRHVVAERDEGLAAQILGGEAGAGGEVVARGHGAERVGAQDGHLGEPAMIDRVGDEPDLALVGDDVAHHLVEPPDIEGNLDIGELGLEGGHDLGEVAQGEARNGADAQPVRAELTDPARHLADAVEPGKAALHLDIEGVGLGGGKELAAGAGEQPEADLALKLGEEPAGGGLGGVELLGGAGDRMGEHEGAENLDMAQPHGSSSYPF